MNYIEAKGARFPALGFGTWDIRGKVCRRMVAAALGMGYRHVDTAESYENEEEVGAGIRDSGVDRDAIYLVSKIKPDGYAKDEVPRRCDAALKRLGVDHLDLYLMHRPNDGIPMGETLEAMAALKEAGKTRAIGVSNFTTRHLREAIETHGADLLCNQVEHHPYLAQDRVKAVLRQHGVLLAAYCPIARGKVMDDPVLQEIGAAHGKAPTQVALRWLLDQDGVFALVRTSQEAHCRSNFEIFDFALSDAERAAIDALKGDFRLVTKGPFVPEWDPV